MVVHGQVCLLGVGVVLAAVRRLVTAGSPPPPPHRGRCRAAGDGVRLLIHFFLLLFLLLYLISVYLIFFVQSLDNGIVN